MMRLGWTRATAALGVTLLVGACNTAPQPEIDSARAAVEKARSEDANRYAGDAMRDAEQAQAALDSELQAQQQAWFPSYERARALASEATVAAERASAEAVEARGKSERASAARAAAARRSAARAESARERASMVAPVKIKDVAPVYPAIARTARVDGTVSIEATVGPDGKIVATNVVRSVPMLDQAALDAVKQWEYEPSRLGGKPVPAVVTVNVNFTRS